MGANRWPPKHSEPMESENQRDAMVVGSTSAYYRSETLVPALVISLQRTICLDKYWFCVGPCNGTLCRLRGPQVTLSVMPLAGWRGSLWHIVGSLQRSFEFARSQSCHYTQRLHTSTLHSHTTPTTCLGAGALICMK